MCSWPVRTAQAGWGTASPHPFSLLPEDPGGLPGPPESHLSSLHGKHEPGGAAAVRADSGPLVLNPALEGPGRPSAFLLGEGLGALTAVPQWGLA